MDTQLKKSIIILLLFVLLISYVGRGVAGGGEYKFNFEKASKGCAEHSKQEACEVYTPLFHIIAHPFAFHPNAFFYFSVMLIGFFIPLGLYYLTRNWFSVWLFLGTNFFYFHIDGVMPQALAMGLALWILAIKDWRIQAGLVLLGIMAHSQGFYLCLSAFAVNRLWLYVSSKDFDYRKIFLSCSGVFGTNRPDVLDEIVYGKTEGVITTAYPITLTNILSLFSKFFPLPLWVIAFYYSLEHNYRLDLIALATGSLLFAFISGGAHRSWYIIPLLLIPSVSMCFMGLSRKYKALLFLFTWGMAIFQFYSWWNYKVLCQ